MKKKSITQQATAILVGLLFVTGTISPGVASAQCAPPAGLFQLPLNQIPVPEPPNILDFVKNRDAAIKLGKALFWDMQVGSDGVTACATCHFSAGVDKRLKNTINPGSRAAVPDTTFQVRRPNESLDVDGVGLDSDFPFHLRDNPDIQASTILRDTNDVVGSQGVKRTDFISIAFGSAVDNGTPVLDPVFNLDTPAATDVNRNTRRVTARNTPSNINAIFNFQNFWDGRAHFTFNGVNPFGPLDTTAGVWSNATGTLVKEKITIDLASLASQATGPPLDDTEMSWKDRTFPELGRKMINNGLIPLGKQLVHPADSVLGTLSKAVKQLNGKITGANGLNATYKDMIEAAFVDTWWNNTTGTVTVNTVSGPQQFTQMEANFSLFWGLAIQLYEATLVADQTDFDRMLGGNPNAMTQQECNGMNQFFGAALCSACHAGTELTNASVTAGAFITNIDHALIEQMVVANGTDGIYDNGFNTTAVRPASDDAARGGNSPFDNILTGQKLPLSFSMLAEIQAVGNLPFQTPFMPVELPPNFPVTNNGSFKVPGMRNIELTAPYFHNGDSLTLEQMVDFYTRGGNFPNDPVTRANLDTNIRELGQLGGGGGDAATAAMVAFMKSLTDERVRNESAPFDHPEIFIPNGDPNIIAPDVLMRIPAKDAGGIAAPPIALTLDAVPGLTNRASIQVSGTKESAGTTVQVQVNAAAPVQATATTDITWSATIDLATGLNTITVTGTDALGSVTLTAAVTRTISAGSFSGGPVTIVDALRALHIAVGLIAPSVDDLLRGDVSPLANGVPAPDGRIGVDDALLILKKVAGLVSF